MGGDKAASPVAQPVPVAMLAEGGSASDVGGQWSVARVEGKRLTLSGAAMPERGLLTLVTPVDGRRFVGEVLCRIEEAPGTCWVVAMPGNDLPEVGDVFVRAPPEAR